MNDLTTYRRLPGYSTVGTEEQLPPGSYSSAVADWVPDTTLQAIADAWADVSNFGVRYAVREQAPELAALLDGLEGDNDAGREPALDTDALDEMTGGNPYGH